APDVVVVDLGRERVVLPRLTGRRDDVDVAVEEEGRSGAAAAGTRDQVRAFRLARVDAGLEAGVAQEALDERDAFALVAGRVGRVEADETLEKLGRRTPDLGRLGRGRHQAGCWTRYSEIPVPRRPSHSYSVRPSFTCVRRPSRRWRRGATSSARPVRMVSRPATSRARATKER